MDPDFAAFEAAFEQAFSSFGTIGAYSNGSLTPPTSADDVLNMTVGEYLALLDLAEQTLLSLDRSIFTFILGNPAIADQLDPVARGFIEDWAQGDFSAISEPFSQVRAAMAQFPASTPLRDAINTLDPTGQTVDDIDAAFADAQQRAAELLWNEQDGIFASPQFTVDPDSGIWSVISDAVNGYNGGTLSEFYGLLGEAAGNAIMAFIGDRESVFGQLLGQNTTPSTIDAATNAAEAAAAQAFEALQNLGAQLTEQAASNFADAQAQAESQSQALVDALTNVLPGLGGVLDTLIIGSRNSDPSFVVSLDGNVQGSEHGDWFYLSKQADTFDGGLGKDVLFGREGEDTLSGGADEDQLFGGDDNDHLTGGAGNDGIHGGAGDDDMAAFSAGMGRYTTQFLADGTVLVQDRQTDGDGLDLLTGIEKIDFSGEMLNLSKVQGIAGLDQGQIDTFIELYIAYFNRAPDALGLYFWGSAFATGTSMTEIAALFLDQDETRATYPEDASNLDFATQVYSNVLGRTPDPGGLNFWVSQLDQGNVDRGTFILEILAGAKADPQPGATQEFIDLQLGDRAFLADKTDIGTYFAVIKGMSDVSDASAAMDLYLRGDAGSVQSAINRVDLDFADAVQADSGEALLQLIGVAADPFSVL